MTQIAFIGLGNMGGPMAGNLVKAGHTVTGHDLVPALCEAAKGEGLTIAASGPEAVARAEVVVTMLPAGRHVLAVWSDIVPAIGKGALVIDCSTIDVESAPRRPMRSQPRPASHRSTRPSPAARSAPRARP